MSDKPNLRSDIVDFFKSLPISKEIWTFLGLTFFSILTLVTCVNLAPQIDENVFFSSSDPEFQTELQIKKLFGSAGTELVISVEGDIDSPQYLGRIERITAAIQNITGVQSVISLSHGPKNLKEAIEGPMWNRLIIAQDRKSTLIIAVIDLTRSKAIVPQIEAISEKFSDNETQLAISGFPYMVELIARNLTRDLTVFSTLAFLVFGIMIYLIFKSRSILFGTYVVCLNACLLTLLILSFFNVPIGLISSNVPLIVFIMTLSHIIFITFNWQIALSHDSQNPVDEGVKATFSASFWSMLTTLLGFVSLMSVPAKPLRDFGVSGAIGCAVALIVVYTLFPAFLRNVRNVHLNEGRFLKGITRVFQFLEKHVVTLIFTMILIVLVVAPGLSKLNTDPSLFSYFKKDSELYNGLQYIDRNGGSSPLVIVVHDTDYSSLVSNAAFNKMWDLQEGLEGHKSVGQVLSLPVLLSQVLREPFAFLLSKSFLVKILEGENLDEVAKGFVTPDRRYGLYLLRMYEGGRTQSRLEIIDELKQIVSSRNLEVKLVGGVYSLQGNLSQLIEASMVSGISKLLIIFGLIIGFISRSLRMAVATILGVMLIPVFILGFSGIYGIPLDIVSAPASNVAIGMGIDSIIHMINIRRRHMNSKKEGDWQKVKKQLYRPIFTSISVVSVGFIIFIMSIFPPLQRFGISIVFGSILAGLIALYVVPLLFNFKLPKIK